MADVELWQYALLVVAGIVGGIINTMAGGGSVLTVPIMIFMGVEGPVANGSNRIGIWTQNVIAAFTFFKGGVSNLKLSFTLSACAIPGALIGAYTGTSLTTDDFNKILAVVMIAVLILMQTGRKKGAKVALGAEPKNLLAGHILMVLAGFWGGFIQIGMGFIIMPIMNRVMGMDLLATNAHKAFIVAAYTTGALAIFAWNSEVLWFIGGILAVGNSIGGYLGAKLALREGETLIRRVLTVAMIIMIIKLLFF